MKAKEKLDQRLAELQSKAKRSLGQNFLVSDQVIERIIKAVQASNPVRIIEVGPGLGALTDFLIQMNKPLQLIELDSVFAEYWREQGQQVIEEDALKINWQQLYLEHPVTLVSNLPYQISSGIVIERSCEETGVDAMVLMFQKEVAQRIKAQKSTEDYSMLSVMAQTFWQIEKVIDASGRDFFPPPKVNSRVLSFRRKESKIKNRKLYLELLKTAFAQRRKVMKTNMQSMLKRYKISEDTFIAWLLKNKLTETARAEELTVENFQDLYFMMGLDL